MGCAICNNQLSPVESKVSLFFVVHWLSGLIYSLTYKQIFLCLWARSHCWLNQINNYAPQLLHVWSGRVPALATMHLFTMKVASSVYREKQFAHYVCSTSMQLSSPEILSLPIVMILTKEGIVWFSTAGYCNSFSVSINQATLYCFLVSPNYFNLYSEMLLMCVKSLDVDCTLEMLSGHINMNTYVNTTE